MAHNCVPTRQHLEPDMLTDLAGRIRNLPNLSPANSLMPVLEAVVNSIQSIQNRGGTGSIVVEIARDRTQRGLFTDESQFPVASCTITDDGEGFVDANYKSFTTSDSTLKTKIGGKGIGRFLWLKAFERAEIQSTYTEYGKCLRRSFTFVPVGDGIEALSLADSQIKERKTVVRLVGLKREYTNVFSRVLQRIAERIIEHCMLYFLSGTAPNITVRDAEESLNLNEIYTKEYDQHAAVDAFHLGRRTFTVTHVRLYAPHEREHYLHFCAHHRSVTKERLIRHVPNMVNRLMCDGRAFVCIRPVDPILAWCVPSP
jgi:hypothetical protein